MTRTCPHCRRRVPVIYEGDGTAADCAPVALYDEHDPCPGSYEPVDAPEPTPEPPPPEAPRKRRPSRRIPLRDHVLQLLRDRPRTTVELEAACAASSGGITHVTRLLLAAGIVEREGTGRPGQPYTWRLSVS